MLHRLTDLINRALTVCAAATALLVTPAAIQAQNCTDSPNDCYTPNLFVGGCNNLNCCTVVCTVEPACCDVAWDDLCVALAVKLCSGCGTSKESCFEVHDSPNCNNGLLCEAVCDVDPACCETEWDEGCVKIAIEVTDECGEPATGSCLVPHENPNCANAECCETVCGIDPRCCETTWDQTCVNWAVQYCFTCGSNRAGSCCFQNDTPYCDDRLCCEAVCDVDPFCCETRWDSVCASLATGPGGVCNLPKCRCGIDTPIPGQNLSCLVVHAAPGCSDAACCDSVCYLDPFCCVVGWDYTCTQLARSQCALSGDPGIDTVCSRSSGSCFVVREDEGCSDDACCARVCAVDPLCCIVAWDSSCVKNADLLCNGCGDIESGSCFWPHGGTGCFDAACCERVCSIDPICCAVEWDALCVATANAACGGGGSECGSDLARPCNVATFLPGCSDRECCEVRCVIDPTCCQRAWDETCALAAAFDCDIDFPRCPSRGSPLEPHANPGSSNEICCEAVCAVDPICCIANWSERCVDIAKTVCITLEVCPSVGRCDQRRPTPGCQDATCCQIVCAADPFCCSESWSSTCVSLARTLCVPRDSSPCPCGASCFEASDTTVGCNDEVCCAGVCAVDPNCCEVAWDSGCVTIARTICCGFPDCGDNCATDCFTPSAKPFCNDASCCLAVCRFEPYCCDVRWDSSCVAAAAITCGGGCGLPSAGNCFTENGTPGCSDGECCQRVCASGDFAYCCKIEWDEACAERAIEVCTDTRPSCGQVGLPGCNIERNAPACRDRDCCQAICVLDEFCCDVAWDETCVEMIYTTKGCERYQYDCGSSCAGDCCKAHDTPWCNDKACCEVICNLDIFCCDVRWDEFCAAAANISPACSRTCPDPACGDPAAGSCCFPHDNANCDDRTCCEAVCVIDQFCCDVVWDGACAAIAISECDVCEGGLSCGDPEAGSCCNEHDEPFCNQAKCCVLVCSFDETCCIVEWDTTCVILAQTFCGCGSLTGGVDEAKVDAMLEGGFLDERGAAHLEAATRALKSKKGAQPSVKPGVSTKK